MAETGAWCEAENLLSSMYSFHHRCSALQDDGSIAGFRRLLAGLVAHLAGDEQELWPGLSAADLCAMTAAAAVLEGSTTWFGGYGAALLAVAADEPEDLQPEPGRLALLVVGLDEWSFRTHRQAAAPAH